MKTKLYATLTGAAIIATGFTPVPLTDPALPPATGLEYAFALLAFVPFLILSVGALSKRRLPATSAIGCALAVAVIGGCVTLFISAFSGAGTKIVALHGGALTLAVGTSFLLVSACDHRWKRIALGFFSCVVCVGAWSLAMVPVAYADASRKATKRPLCIAAHSPTKKEVASLAGLRGLAFYTTLSGYKMGDTWYFHGLLVVDGQDGIEVHHWSPRRMRFQKLKEPQKMLANPLGACRPRPGFLQALSLI